MLLASYVCFYSFSYVYVTDWPPIGKIAAHSAYDVFSSYKYLGLVTRMHRKFPFLRHTYDELEMTALEFTPLLYQLL